MIFLTHLFEFRFELNLFIREYLKHKLKISLFNIDLEILPMKKNISPYIFNFNHTNQIKKNKYKTPKKHINLYKSY